MISSSHSTFHSLHAFTLEARAYPASRDSVTYRLLKAMIDMILIICNGRRYQILPTESYIEMDLAYLAQQGSGQQGYTTRQGTGFARDKVEITRGEICFAVGVDRGILG
jgi:hypothetical protein